jgi:hypothetical protein
MSQIKIKIKFTRSLPAAMTATRGLITVATDQSVINIWQ